MKKMVKIIRSEDLARGQYVRLLADLDYHLASLHHAIAQSLVEEKARILSTLTDLQHELSTLETTNPQLKKLKMQ